MELETQRGRGQSLGLSEAKAMLPGYGTTKHNVKPERGGEFHVTPQNSRKVANGSGAAALAGIQSLETPATDVRRWTNSDISSDGSECRQARLLGGEEGSSSVVSDDALMARMDHLLRTLGSIHEEVALELGDITKRANSSLVVLLSPASPSNATSAEGQSRHQASKQDAADRLRSSLINSRRRISSCLEREQLALVDFALRIRDMRRKRGGGAMFSKSEPTTDTAAAATSAIPLGVSMTPAAVRSSPTAEKRLCTLKKMERYLMQRVDSHSAAGDTVGLASVEKDLDKVRRAMGLSISGTMSSDSRDEEDAVLIASPVAKSLEPSSVEKASAGFERLMNKISAGPTPTRGKDDTARRRGALGERTPTSVASDANSSWKVMRETAGEVGHRDYVHGHHHGGRSTPPAVSRYGRAIRLVDMEKENAWPWLSREVGENLEDKDECLM